MTINSSIPPLRTSEPISAVRRAEEFISASDAELAAIDPLELNLTVAKGAERDLDIPRYKAMADEWAEAILAQMPIAEEQFYRLPRRWLNDIRYARLAVMACYVNDVLRMRYHEGHDEEQQAAPVYAPWRSVSARPHGHSLGNLRQHAHAARGPWLAVGLARFAGMRRVTLRVPVR
jgi:hypothetical protein